VEPQPTTNTLGGVAISPNNPNATVGGVPQQPVIQR
jgi:hypothetical protein